MEKEARIGTPGSKPAQSDTFNLNFGHRTKRRIWLLKDVYFGMFVFQVLVNWKNLKDPFSISHRVCSTKAVL